MAYTPKTNRRMRPYKMRAPIVTLPDARRELAQRYRFALDKGEQVVTISTDAAFTLLRKLHRPRRERQA